MKTLITDLRSALLFITILPAGKNVVYSPIGMIKYFPVVGLILGGLLMAFDWGASFLWPPGVVAALDVIFLVVMTGAFHLDGLGDAADGLFSHRPKEQVLEIMKDSRTGMMGLVVIFCVLALKIAGIYGLKINGQASEGLSQYMFQAGFVLLFVPAYSRAATLFGIRFLDYGRKNTGTGLDLFEKPIGFKDFFFVLIIGGASFVLGYKCLVLNVMFIITTILILWFYKRKLNCITGDMLGAMTEVIEAVLFLTAGAALI